MPKKRPLNVFISYASQDRAKVRQLYNALKKESWINPWFDKEELLPGMDWDLEIYKALRKADVILPCFSQESIAKEGYVQKEFKRALDYAEEKPDGTIYVIPLRLDACTPPRRFNQWQWVDYFDAGTHGNLFKALHRRAENLRILSGTFASAAQPAVSTTSTKTTPSGHPIYTFGQMEFVKVPAGEFWMGSNDGDDDEKPEHLLYLDYDFYMARFPVTNRQYARMVGSLVVSRAKVNHPVVKVSWDDAQKYVQWLNQRYGKNLPQGYIFRLPSEAEWEKAARGSDGNIYPWSDEFDAKKCNSEESGIGTTTPAGKYSPQGDSPYGCADMAGNVWEWTRTIWADKFKYPYRFDDGREDEKANSPRVLRGGAFNDHRDLLRCAYRYGRNPGNGFSNRGFRIVVSPSLS